MKKTIIVSLSFFVLLFAISCSRRVVVVVSEKPNASNFLTDSSSYNTIPVEEQNIMTQNTFKAKKKYKVGVALSGGGIKGLCHAGAFKALEEYGIKPDIISGVSAGGIVGALYADGMSPDSIYSFFKGITFSKMTKFQLSSDGFFSIESFGELIGEQLKAKTFEELKIPLRVVATDLDHGKSVTFSSGELLRPLIASSSLPVLFSPTIINDTTYVDGGVLKNFPVSIIRDDTEYVIGLNCSPMVANDYKVNIVNIATRSYHFMFKANILHDKMLCDILIEPKEMGNYETFEVEKSQEMFDLGYNAAKEILESEAGQKFLKAIKQ